MRIRTGTLVRAVTVAFDTARDVRLTQAERRALAEIARAAATLATLPPAGRRAAVEAVETLAEAPGSERADVWYVD